MVSQRGRLAIAAAVAGLSFGSAVQAQLLYWDLDGPTAGAGGATPTGTWDNGTALDDQLVPAPQVPTTNWNATSDGTGAAATWDQTNQLSDAVLSAGTDATGNYTVTVATNNKIFANSLTIEEGNVTILQGNGAGSSTSNINFTPGVGQITLEANTSLSFVNQLTFIGFTTGTSGILMKNGSKLITTNTGTGGSFFNSNAPISIEADATVTLSAAAVGGSLHGSGITSLGGTTTVIKEGAGDYRIQATGGSSFTKLVVNGGMYRPGNAWAVNVVETPGNNGAFGLVPASPMADNITLNNNGGLGNVNNITLHENRGVVLGSTGGRIDVQNGQMTIAGPISGPGSLTLDRTNPAATGASTQILSGTNTYGGSTLINRGSLTVLNGAAIPDGSAVVIGTAAGGNFNVGATGGTPSVSETIGSLAGGNDTIGNVVITNSASVLTTGADNTSTNWAGRMNGAGSLVKIGTGTLTLSGGVTNLRSGNTNVNAGTLALNKTAGDAIAGTTVTVGDGSATAATLRLDASNQINDGTNLVVDGANAAFDMQGNSETVNTVFLEGSSIIGTGGATLTPVTTFEMKEGSVSGVTLAGSTKALNKTTAGTVTINKASTYTGGTNVNGGTLEVFNMHSGNAVSVAAGATLRVLHTAPTGANPESGDNAAVSQPSSLTIAAGGTVDLTNNDLIINYTGGPSPAAALEDLVAQGFNGGDWLGTGITSSTAANDSNFHLAIADNAALAQPYGTAGGGPLFSGVDVALESVLIKFTHRVDLDLDGLVTPNDAAIFAGNYSENDPATWATGDVDLDGIYTPNDAAVFSGFYDESLTSVPEPASLGLIGLLGLGLARRRRHA